MLRAGGSSKPPEGGAYPGAHTQMDVLPCNTYNHHRQALLSKQTGES